MRPLLQENQDLTFGGNGTVNDINNQGKAVGRASDAPVNGNFSPCVWGPPYGTVQRIFTPIGWEGTALAVNDSDVTVGQAGPKGGTQVAILWSPDGNRMQPLFPNNNVPSVATGVNEFGWITAILYAASGPQGFVISNQGTSTPLPGLPGGRGTVPLGISNLFLVSGYSIDRTGQKEATVWAGSPDGTAFKPFVVGPPGSEALNSNGLGHVLVLDGKGDLGVLRGPTDSQSLHDSLPLGAAGFVAGTAFATPERIPKFGFNDFDSIAGAVRLAGGQIVGGLLTKVSMPLPEEKVQPALKRIDDLEALVKRRNGSIKPGPGAHGIPGYEEQFLWIVQNHLKSAREKVGEKDKTGYIDQMASIYNLVVYETMIPNIGEIATKAGDAIKEVGGEVPPLPEILYPLVR